MIIMNKCFKYSAMRLLVELILIIWWSVVYNFWVKFSSFNNCIVYTLERYRTVLYENQKKQYWPKSEVAKTGICCLTGRYG